MLQDRRRLDATLVYLIFSGVSSLSFSLIVTVNLVYQVEVAKLNPLQLVLVGTALEVVCFLCQVPTGVLADVYSRRLSVIVGVFLLDAGFILEDSIPLFAPIVVAQGLFGIGATFMDGAELSDGKISANHQRAFSIPGERDKPYRSITRLSSRLSH